MSPEQPAQPGSAARPVVRVERGVRNEDTDHLAEEVPVAMHFDGSPFAVMMATPADLEDFARGFALTEGKVASMLEIEDIDVREVLEGVVVDVHTSRGRRGEPRPSLATDDAGARTRGELPGRSGCGICGSRELEDVVRHPPPVAAGPVVTPDAIERALDALRARQPVNAATGAVHAAAWALADGTIVDVREDVGRHNALDKLIGAMLVALTDPRDGFLVITSRASYEMVTKAAVAGMTMVVAISAPTALAVHLAADCGVTLLGFARPGRFNIYSRPERIG
ncbi:formate dehydrogenase accessory sulfurtransferase FdhD [Luteibacter jiangsuensis]|uniref:Sulfur carrier protein FdhD n=1 Tax=Luteibacter jiangsuensis TaxID=637577 RepID=A0ABX0Q664_9GAMM|nr:formate dehydrogenase accessory sulfurtransferase FdhD [Luteibacter jiangsuensis]NID05162.1 formate dehydrogenase accessory sulfurtransferase FdhD [Luteibacter jiangsuensis]